MGQQLKLTLCFCLFVLGLAFGGKVRGQAAAQCSTAISVALDSTGLAQISVGDINNGSSGSVFSLSDSVFDCSDTVPQVVLLTVMDSSTTSTCSTSVAVVDTICPHIECLDSIVLIYGGGALDQITITPADVLTSAWDNCDSASLAFSISKSVFNFPQDTISDTIRVLAADARNNKDSADVVVHFRTGCRKYSPFCQSCYDLNIEGMSSGRISTNLNPLSCGDQYFRLEWISPLEPLRQRNYTSCLDQLGPDCQVVMDQNDCPINVYGIDIMDIHCEISISRFTACSDSCAVNCYGDSSAIISVLANGGAPPYTYQWSPIVSTNDTLFGVPAGIYTVTVTDLLFNSIVDTIVVTQPDSISVTFAGTNSTCGNSNDGAIMTTVTGGCTPYSYLWNTGATTSSLTGISSGTYSVTVTDANMCNKVGSYFLNSNSFADFIYSPFGSASTLSFMNGSNFGHVWSWDFGDGGTSSLENPIHSYVTAGAYMVCLTVTDTTNGCSDSTCHPVDILIGMDGRNTLPGLSIYPNPADDEFRLKVQVPLLDRIQMQICDLPGRCHHAQSFFGLRGEVLIDVRALPPGLYLVEITTASGACKTFKLIVQ